MIEILLILIHIVRSVPGDWNSNTAGYVTTYSQTELFSLRTFGPLNSFRHPARTIGYPQSQAQKW